MPMPLPTRQLPPSDVADDVADDVAGVVLQAPPLYRKNATISELFGAFSQLDEGFTGKINQQVCRIATSCASFLA